MGIHGKIVDHPDGKAALVLPLLNTAEYFTLGNPPSFDSITRDTYSADNKFSLQFIVNVAKNTASACDYLHSIGVLHGDVYAHNTLTRRNGDSLLTDFGASTIVSDIMSIEEKNLLQKMEVRAFGCLLDDLLVRIDTSSMISAQDPVTYNSLRVLADRCGAAPEDRPNFSEIVASLSTLSLEPNQNEKEF